jgi:hypothetical protein
LRSYEIHQEWISNVLKNRPDLKETQLLRTKAYMDDNARDALVTDFESLIPSLKLPDENDRHVLAAAIRCSAGVIVTFNLKDFPSDYLSLEFRLIKSTQKEPDRIKSGQTKVLSRKSTK